MSNSSDIESGLACTVPRLPDFFQEIKMSENLIEDIQAVIKSLAVGISRGGRIIGGGSRLIEDLSIDSMSLVELVLEVNNAFGIELSEDEVGEWRTVQDIVESVRRHMEGSA
ncbi:acyl carrier protein [Pseudomonas fluorescens]|uniref:acyl carrier protein n=1 Tax=Pseudomonas fluorescens TaxID=294 RepID=UPI001FD688F1|nr:phosphopantetheine-binding protein [Pseudomonas fluorescens]